MAAEETVRAYVKAMARAADLDPEETRNGKAARAYAARYGVDIDNLEL